MSEKQISGTRNYDVDWLRVLGMCAVFFFHCARFFDRGPWHVKNYEVSLGLTIFVGFLAQWLMPLFFVTSGMSSYYALALRTKGQYASERFTRLFIPLLFGILVLIPPQVYIERATQAGFSGSFFDFLPYYFDGLYGIGGNFAWMGLHLWYLEVLFLYSMITLPLFWALRKKIARYSRFAGLPLPVFLFALPLVAIEALVNTQPHGLGMREFGGWNIITYLVLFVYGYLIASDEGIRKGMGRQTAPAIVLGLATTLLGFVMIRFDYSSYSPSFSVVRAFNSWCWLVAIFGLAERFLRFNSSRALPRLNEAVLPFYILHQTVIVIIGYFIASWHTGTVVKYPLLVISSFTVIMLVYEFAIRRIPILRFLFGMKPDRPR
jgi:glucans biosynthesis protein C